VDAAAASRQPASDANGDGAPSPRCVPSGGRSEPVAVLDGKAMRISVIFDLVARRAFKGKMHPSMVELSRAYASQAAERSPE
jgi:hypothetical protein